MGVRRYQNPDGSLTAAGKKRELRKEYQRDKLIRYELTRNAEASSSWSKQYNKMYDRQVKSTVKRVDRDLKKNNKISDKTGRKIIEGAILKGDTKSMNQRRQMDIDALQKHVDNMVKKYPDKKIKDVKTKTLKNGQKYVNSSLLSPSYELRPKVVIINGKARVRYVPVSVTYGYVPV